ncbi:MAG: ATP-dependent zinc metalloprotease FtsH [Roseibacillus sp.]
MADEQPPNQTPNDPNKQGESGGSSFNWRVLILFAIALGLLTIAWANVGKGAGKAISFKQFKQLMEEGRVVRSDSLNQFRLEVVTNESSFNAQIVGFQTKDPIVHPHGASHPFKVRVNLDLDDAKLKELLGSRIRTVPPTETTAEDDQEDFTFAEFERWVNDYEVILKGESALKLASIPGGSDAYLMGIRQPKKSASATEILGLRPKPTKFRVPVNTITMEDELKALFLGGVPYRQETAYLRTVLMSFLPILILIVLLFFLFRHQMKQAGRGAMSFGKSKARMTNTDGNKVTFNDVAGIQEAKEELWEIVEFLKDPRKFQKLGASIPKGVLMVGAPGTGKTLLARAIAGEASVPFFTISGSDFVEMFVGVGASRVRDMFEQGKKHAPCLIFIDEIDAVGRHRGHGLGGGHDEREQTLNALLVEMDGFDTQEGVIIIAATNRPDVLDPALLRPGRFDRQVTISLPDVKGREEILKVHAKKIKLAAGTNLGILARGTPGFSGAELANIINEAALLAASKDLKAVTLVELEEARDKVRWGRERRSLALSEKEKRVTAYHEAGHALLLATLEHTDPLHKVTIIPRGPYLGAAFHLPDGDKFHYHKIEGLEELIVTMGGRVSEEIVFGDVTSGASGDIRQATALARRMVCEWGMSEELGMVEYGEPRGEVFLARDIAQPKTYSEQTAQKIDSEIKRIIDCAFAEAKRMLTDKREQLELIAQALLEYETLDGAQIADLIELGEMKNPPRSPKPPDLPPEVLPTASKKKNEDDIEDGDGPLPEPMGAPA